MSNLSLTTADFEPIKLQRETQTISRPSLSYWRDAWVRLKTNKRALISLFIIVGLLVFTIAGPWIWTIDPSAQDLDQLSTPPGANRVAKIVAPYHPWAGVTTEPAPISTQPTWATQEVRLAEPATTQAVRLEWDPVPAATGYRVYRNIYDPEPDGALGLPIGEIYDARRVSYEDLLDLSPTRFWYSIVATDDLGREVAEYTTLVVDVVRVITIDQAVVAGLEGPNGPLELGDEVLIKFHPLGTDYLGRDMLARLMYGARVSLFIGIIAPLFFVLIGILYGSAAGFIGGKTDQILMRFADFVVALPFLLFMILFKIAFGIGPGESGIFPMLVALVVLSWPATARLVRGQILQIREEAYIGASQLLGAKTYYLILRHMIPNTLGVILVTLTFAVPTVIFVEAFLSFIGMGVAPPTPSWGSMCNEGIQTMLNHPHELIFPALFISITVLAFNLLGDGLRDALDARMRSRE
ncbi:MAG: hypothetical protein CMM56_10650 [Rhodospirillaceae bacterium]|nr:hypothetical protein [Rhodospirillaceae bacterium]